MHITYDIKNGVEYAKLCQSIRCGKKIEKTSVNLGRVINKEKGIYKNRERGVFIYDLRACPKSLVFEVFPCRRFPFPSGGRALFPILKVKHEQTGEELYAPTI